MGRRALIVIVIGALLLPACGGSGGDGSGPGNAGASPSLPAETVTVSGILDAKLLDEGMCAWVETEDGRIEVWVGEEHGQVFAFLEDGAFEGIRAVDPAQEDGIGGIVLARGDRIDVTGVRYTSTPECGTYGVDASGPITAG